MESFWNRNKDRIVLYYWNTYVGTVERFQSTFHLPCTGSFLTQRVCSWKQTVLVIRTGRSIKDLSFLINRIKSPALKSFFSLAIPDLKGSLESDLKICYYSNIAKIQAEGLIQQDVLLFQLYILFYILISAID